MTGSKEAFFCHKKWAEYFLSNLNGQEPIAINSSTPVQELKNDLEQFVIPKRLHDKDEKGFIIGTVLLSYHHYACFGLMLGIVLASYLALWLKKYVIPYAPRECSTLKDLYPTVLLTSGRSLGFLLGMICRIHGD